MNFEQIFWLFAAVAALPILTLLYIHVEKGKRNRLEAFAAFKLLSQLAASFSPRKRNLKTGLTIAASCLVLLALARPQWGYEWQETKGKGIDILIALDTSKSMLAEDVKPNRMERAKLAILDLLERIEGDRVGLIAFSGSAFLQCPLTLDYNAFRLTLETIDTSVISRGGTNFAAAIAEAQASFAEDDNFKILVLITDGEDLEAAGVEQARAAAEEGVKVYTVGVGSPGGELIPVRGENGSVDFLRDEKGNVIKTRLDEVTLNEISNITDAFYVPLGSRGEGLERVYRVGLESIPKQEREAHLQKLPFERFQWPLGLAVTALIAESLVSSRKRERRRPSKRALLLILPFLLLLLLLPNWIRASPATAERHYNEGNYSEAKEAYEKAIEKAPDDERLYYNLGSTEYREGLFESAEEAYKEALQTDDLAIQEDTFYNLGNTRYRLGETALQLDPQETIRLWEEGLKDYENALNLNPEDEDARFNFDFVTKRLEELKKQLEQQEQQQQDQQEEDQNQEQEQQDQKGEESQTEQNQNREEQNQENQQQDQNQQEQNSQENQNQSGEQDEQSSQEGKREPQPQPHEAGEEEESAEEKQERRALGLMTREEARQLLESLKDEERKLPITVFEFPDHQNPELKDW